MQPFDLCISLGRALAASGEMGIDDAERATIEVEAGGDSALVAGTERTCAARAHACSAEGRVLFAHENKENHADENLAGDQVAILQRLGDGTLPHVDLVRYRVEEAIGRVIAR